MTTSGRNRASSACSAASLPVTKQRATNVDWKQALGPRLHQRDFIKKLSKLKIFADISPIQEQYLNATSLKDVNLPMSDAHEYKVARYLKDITVQPLAPPSFHLFPTLSASFTRDSSNSSTSQAHMQWINRPAAPRTARAGVTPTTGSRRSPASLDPHAPLPRQSCPLNKSCLSWIHLLFLEKMTTN
jgi:hypothetical protein